MKGVVERDEGGKDERKKGEEKRWVWWLSHSQYGVWERKPFLANDNNSWLAIIEAGEW